jgi:tol-pal system protein YbgF
MRNARTFMLIALVLAGWSSFSSRAGLFDDEEARKAILDLRREVRDRADTTDKNLAETTDRTNRAQLDLANQIERLREEVTKLRGQVELLTNEIAQQQKKSRDLYGDLDARIKVFEPRKITVDGREGSVERLEEQAYNQALDLFKSGDMKGAAAAFNQFMGQYPQSLFSSPAMYWSGAAQYGSKDFRSAIATMTRYIERFPDSPRIPDAWLTIGNAQIDAGDKRAANKSLSKLIADFPTSQAAQMAKERLPATAGK